MPFKFLQNVTPTSFVDTFFQWKNFMKSAVTDPTPGPGWSVAYSSDGQSSRTNFSGDNISSNGSGSNGLNNPNAWFILKPPSPQTRSFCFQRDQSSSNAWRIKYSFGGFNISTATYNKTPQPTTTGDEALLCGGGTDASPTFYNIFVGLLEKKYVFHAAADTATSAFYFFAYPVSKLSDSNASAKIMMIHDPLQSGSYASQDTDPSVTGVFSSSGNGNNISRLTMPSDYSTQSFFGSFDKIDGSGRIYDKFSIASYGRVDTTNSFTMTSNQVGNPHTLKQDLFPCMYFCKSTSNGIYYNGYKGCSSFAFVGPGGFSNGHSFTLDSVKDKILVNGFVLPWSGNGSYLLA